MVDRDERHDDMGKLLIAHQHRQLCYPLLQMRRQSDQDGPLLPVLIEAAVSAGQHKNLWLGQLASEELV